MTNSEQAIREFAEKWCLRVIECMKDDDYIMHDPEGILSDLTALIEEHYVAKEDVGYPKAFIEWIGDDCSPCYLERKEDDQGYGKWIVFKRNSMEHEVEFDTLDELYQYWKENVR